MSQQSSQGGGSSGGGSSLLHSQSQLSQGSLDENHLALHLLSPPRDQVCSSSIPPPTNSPSSQFTLGAWCCESLFVFRPQVSSVELVVGISGFTKGIGGLEIFPIGSNVHNCDLCFHLIGYRDLDYMMAPQRRCLRCPSVQLLLCQKNLSCNWQKYQATLFIGGTPLFQKVDYLTGQVPNEDVERKFQHLASSVHKMGMVLDSVQNDCMQLNRAMKEASLDSKFP
ncbi:hypothetical protein PR202_ga27374 [Eleusine coracana subsp. coracana]|uniref:Uncharacterized protein n=1 Tax=Eleusine coracana subsp. coracana TaxID=191504 RepID=A0AAV5DGZ0_ELECO|nr:hypothetical protein PR202_ga27374 [Eleusine coracana subsp. coracana]